jgi:hypothetical protein
MLALPSRLSMCFVDFPVCTYVRSKRMPQLSAHWFPVHILLYLSGCFAYKSWIIVSHLSYGEQRFVYNHEYVFAMKGCQKKGMNCIANVQSMSRLQSHAIII